MALGRQGGRQTELMVGWADLPRSPGPSLRSAGTWRGLRCAAVVDFVGLFGLSGVAQGKIL